MKTARFLPMVGGICLAIAGCGKSQPENPQASPASAATPPKPALPEMTVQSGGTLRGFRLHFISKETNWRTTPMATRISDSETREIPKEKLRGLRVTNVDRDARGDVKWMNVVYTMVDGEIAGGMAQSGYFSVQLYFSPEKPLSVDELNQLFPKSIGFHLNYELNEIAGTQYLRVPLCQIKSVTFPDGAMGDGLGPR